MAISEAARSDLYNGLRDVLGPERTETLMSAIAWHTVDEVATKGDLAVLRTEIAELRTELKTDIANLETRLIRAMTNWMVTILVAVIAAIVGVAFLV